MFAVVGYDLFTSDFLVLFSVFFLFTGQLSVKFLQIYDIPLGANNEIYGICRNPCDDNDFIQGYDGVVSSTGQAIFAPDPRDTSLPLKNTIEINLKCAKSDVLKIEVWKKLFSLFDSIIAETSINILPLLLHSSKMIERWFPVRYHDNSTGSILLELLFVGSSLAQMSPKSYVDKSFDHISSNPALGHEIDDSNDDSPSKLDSIFMEDALNSVEKSLQSSNEVSVVSNVDRNVEKANPSSVVSNIATSPSNKQSLITPVEEENIRLNDVSLSQLMISYLKVSMGIGNDAENEIFLNINDRTSNDNYIGKLFIGIVGFQPQTIESSSSSFYFTASMDDIDQGYRSTEFTSASKMNFEFFFNVIHFRSYLKIALFASNSRRKLGEAKVSIFHVLQLQANRYFRPSKTASEELVWNIHDISNHTSIIGKISARLNFVENMNSLYLSNTPMKVPKSPPELLSMERLQIHLTRFKELSDLINSMFAEYSKIVEWENSVLTCVLLWLFVYTCLYLDAEYFLVVPLFLLFVLLTSSMLRRMLGHFEAWWSEPKKKCVALLAEKYQPYSVMKLSILAFRNVPAEFSHAAVKITYHYQNKTIYRDLLHPSSDGSNENGASSLDYYIGSVGNISTSTYLIQYFML